MYLNNIFDKTYKIARDEGVLSLLKRIFRRLRHLVYHERGYFLICEIPLNSAKVESKIPIICEVLRPEELEEFVSVDFYKRSCQELKALCDEERIFVARHKSKIIAGVHQDTAKYGLYNWFVPLEENETRLSMAFTVPGYKGQNVMPALYSFLESYFADRGFHTLLGFADIDNLPSLKSLDKAGFRIIGSVGHLNISDSHLYYCLNIHVLARTKSPFHYRRDR